MASLLLESVEGFSPAIIQDNVVGNEAASEQGFQPHEEDLTRRGRNAKTHVKER